MQTPEEAQPLELGSVLGRYRLCRLIGEGGMGTVYEAEHVVLEKRVALKVLRPELAVHAELRQRFVREGLAASRVRHPHVVEMTDASEENGQAFLVMELLEGHALDEELRQHGPFDIARATEVILPICAALGEAHAVGIVHRDMKPENVLLVRSFGDRIVPKVVDFGISDVIGDAWYRDTGAIVGTPHYMAPEQANGLVVDGLADQYSVAVMLFELVTGKLPYDPSKIDDPTALIEEVAAGRTQRLSEVWKAAPERLDAVIARAMQHDPRRRFATMQRFGRALVPLASARALRRYRDLVDPGWSTVLAAVEANAKAAPSPWKPSTPVPVINAGVLAERAPNGSARCGHGRQGPAPRADQLITTEPPRLEDFDTLRSAPPEMASELVVELVRTKRESAALRPPMPVIEMPAVSLPPPRSHLRATAIAAAVLTIASIVVAIASDLMS